MALPGRKLWSPVWRAAVVHHSSAHPTTAWPVAASFDQAHRKRLILIARQKSDPSFARRSSFWPVADRASSGLFSLGADLLPAASSGLPSDPLAVGSALGFVVGRNLFSGLAAVEIETFAARRFWIVGSVDFAAVDLCSAWIDLAWSFVAAAVVS